MKLEPYEVKVPEGRESEGYVYLRHNTQYTLLLKNLAHTRCDAEVRIDGREVGAWRVPALKTVIIERPVHDTGRFTFYEVGSREADKAGISESDQLGLLTVVFRPETLSLRAPPQPSTSGGLAGGTGLSGQSDQKFRDADWIEHDDANAVTIHLRLVGDPDEPRPMFQRETAVPPPVVPRGRDRQVNQSLESDSTEESSGFTHLPTAENKGNQHPPTLPRQATHALPAASRHVRVANGRFTQEELLKVVSHRENIVTIFLMAVVSAVIIPKFVNSPQALFVLQLAIWGGTGTAFLMLALAMKEKNAWWSFVAAFIPLGNLIMVFRLRSKASSVLQEHGVTISSAFAMNKEIRRMVA
jgi:hypothetical protein